MGDSQVAADLTNGRETLATSKSSRVGLPVGLNLPKSCIIYHKSRFQSTRCWMIARIAPVIVVPSVRLPVNSPLVKGEKIVRFVQNGLDICVPRPYDKVG